MNQLREMIEETQRTGYIEEEQMKWQRREELEDESVIDVTNQNSKSCTGFTAATGQYKGRAENRCCRCHTHVLNKTTIISLDHGGSSPDVPHHTSNIASYPGPLFHGEGPVNYRRLCTNHTMKPGKQDTSYPGLLRERDGLDTRLFCPQPSTDPLFHREGLGTRQSGGPAPSREEEGSGVMPICDLFQLH